MSEKLFYIVCKRHMHRKDHAILFWGPDSSGYQYNTLKAGRYSEQCIARFNDHQSDDMPVQCNIIDAIAIESVIDNNVLGSICRNTASNRKLIGIKLTELLKGDTVWDKRAFCRPKEFLRINEQRIQLVNEIRKRYCNGSLKIDESCELDNNKCPNCNAEIHTEVWVDGICIHCKTPYTWDEDPEDSEPAITIDSMRIRTVSV